LGRSGLAWPVPLNNELSAQCDLRRSPPHGAEHAALTCERPSAPPPLGPHLMRPGMDDEPVLSRHCPPAAARADALRP